jgi:hypothetical protein
MDKNYIRRLTMEQAKIFETIDEALSSVKGLEPDALGYVYWTFRIRYDRQDAHNHKCVGVLLDHGWHLIGGPVIVGAYEDYPEYMAITMLRVVSRPRIQIRGNLGGEIRGQIDGEIRV